MFTSPSAVPPTAGVVVAASYPLINSTSTTSTNPSWRSTTTPPTMVSILNGNSPPIYIATQQPSTTATTTTTANFLRPTSSQTVRLISPSFTLINNSNTIFTGQMPTISTSMNNIQLGTCIDTSVLGQRFEISNNQDEQQACSSILDNNSQDPEIELFVNNVVSSFALGCHLNLRKIAMEASNVIYKRDHAMVLMKIRNPSCSANIWSSGKVTVTGTTSEDDAKRAARKIARCLQRLGFKVKFRNYRVVNCLATCAMPWPIDIEKLRDLHRSFVSYEPEIHPGATVRLSNKAVLKVFTTGSITLTAPSVEVINTAVNEFYPQLFECRKMSRDVQQRQ